MDSDGVPQCKCGFPAVLLTVKKNGSNFGREFYACSKPRGGEGCNFFAWNSPASSVPDESKDEEKDAASSGRPLKRARTNNDKSVYDLLELVANTLAQCYELYQDLKKEIEASRRHNSSCAPTCDADRQFPIMAPCIGKEMGISGFGASHPKEMTCAPSPLNSAKK